jgi:hypothetical protein
MPWLAQDTNSHAIERRFLTKGARRASESAVARPHRVCRARAAHQKPWFFMNECENAHRTQARAHFSKCEPHAGESSMMLTRVGAHDFAYKENEHRAEARAPFSTRMCTARKRERRGASPARRPEAPPPKTHSFFKSKVYVRRTARRRESHEEAQVL